MIDILDLFQPGQPDTSGDTARRPPQELVQRIEQALSECPMPDHVTVSLQEFDAMCGVLDRLDRDCPLQVWGADGAMHDYD